MDEVRRVTFHFAQDVEVRYVAHLPVPGEMVSRGGKRWVVTQVEPDATGGHEARVERPRDVARRVRLDALRRRRLDASQRGRAAVLAQHAADVGDRATQVRARRSS